MFGVDFGELIVIALVVLIVFGPEKLPELLHSVGKILGSIQRELTIAKREFYNSVYTPADELRSRLNDATSNLMSLPGNSPEEKKEDARQKEDKEGAE